MFYDGNSSKRYRNILKHELELKWIELLKAPHSFGFNDTIYHEGNISRLSDFDAFLFQIHVSVIAICDHMVEAK